MNEAPTKGGPVDRSAQPRVGSASGAKRISIDVSATVPLVEEKPKRMYWIGTLKSSPFQNVTVGGTTFPRYMGNILYDKRGEPSHPVLPGQKIPLDEDQVGRILGAVANRVFRWMGDKRAALLTVSGTHQRKYTPSPADEPIGKYLYMYDVTDGAPANYPDGEPDPMVM